MCQRSDLKDVSFERWLLLPASHSERYTVYHSVTQWAWQRFDLGSCSVSVSAHLLFRLTLSIAVQYQYKPWHFSHVLYFECLCSQAPIEEYLNDLKEVSFEKVPPSQWVCQYKCAHRLQCKKAPKKQVDVCPHNLSCWCPKYCERKLCDFWWFQKHCMTYQTFCATRLHRMYCIALQDTLQSPKSIHTFM